jgi:hypothetical protein
LDLQCYGSAHPSVVRFVAVLVALEYLVLSMRFLGVVESYDPGRVLITNNVTAQMVASCLQSLSKKGQ